MGDGEHPYGPASFDPSQTVLGARQERWVQADLLYVERVGAPGAPIETLASFVVEDGRPGAVPA